MRKLIVKVSSFWTEGKLWKVREGEYLFTEQIGKMKYRQELTRRDNIPAVMGLRSVAKNCVPHFEILVDKEAAKIGF